MSLMRTAATTASCLLIALASSSASAQQRIVQWSSQTNANANDNLLALGYPVPVPVDTPLPFDGFRSYNGLHMRHQDLVATTDLVHQHAVGSTRAGRTIWAYRIGDADTTTVSGLPESAMLINGGIHAREWQTPEVVTGIMELLTANADDHGFHRYLLDNVNVTVIPVLNVDGFLQTQRYPRDSWLGTDPEFPASSPRDGRMRRKNMLNADEVMTTQNDHLNGVDLNRNNSPFWATTGSSSANPQSLTHHGAGPQSEPETRALMAAAALGPASQLRVFVDVHSFGRVMLWARTSNQRLTNLTESILTDFLNHHVAYPGNRRYRFPLGSQLAINAGIGTTDELMGHEYQVPAWTLEIEPPGDTAWHRNEPLCGANYGGVAENCHDGFILPESQIRRVRDNLSATLAGVFYRQSGPPTVIAARLFDRDSGALVYESRWDVVSASTRRQVVHQTQPLTLDRDYTYVLTYDKPMRHRSAGVVTGYPGAVPTALGIVDSAFFGSTALNATISNRRWLDQAGGAPAGYARYRDDSVAIDLRFPAAGNAALIGAGGTVNLRHQTADMVGQSVDANPATVARWQNGAWVGYEDNQGAQTDTGGTDASVSLQISAVSAGAPFVVVPGTSSSWYDTARSGQGFVLEILSPTQALAVWFTYNSAGEQDWYTMVGDIRGNRIVFGEVLRTTGGVFGPGFDPTAVTRSIVGSATFNFASCESGWMDWRIDGVDGRLELSRLTRLLGLACGANPAINGPGAGLTGAWYDLSHSGEGYLLEILSTGGAVVYWFSYDAQGNRRWFFGTGEQVNGDWVFPSMTTTRGPRFGADYNPADLQVTPWGRLVLDINCGGGRADYQSPLAGFGNGSLNLSRLTRIDGLACAD